jgi:peptidoglycan/LPS O-acetylase OafA/YrhL
MKLPYEKSEHMLSIDLLRFGASFAVILWHFQSFYNTDVSKLPGYIYFRLFYSHGGQSVLLFWSISGFILAKIYIGRETTIKKFLTSRFARLYPLSFVTLIVVCFLQIFSYYAQVEIFMMQNNDLKHFLLNIFFIPHIGFQDGFSYNVPIWSVTVEIFSYLLFILLVRRLNIFSISFVICLFLLFFIKAQVFIQPEISQCVIYFFCGVLTYKIYSHTGRYLLISSLFFLFINFWQNNLNFGFIQRYTATGLASISLMQGILLLFLSAENYLRKMPRNIRNIIKTFGNLTYSSYLIHFPIQVVILLVAKTQYLSPSVIFLVAYLLFVYSLSWVVYKFYELPMRNWINVRFDNTIRF